MTAEAQWIAGVDGCPGGWIVALMPLRPGPAPVLRLLPRLADLVEGPLAPVMTAVDMPIGLPERIEGPGRAPERAVRGLLGPRASSVFSMPSRAAVEAGSYEEACRIAAATSDPPRRISKQGFMLFPKVREVDALLRARPDLVDRIREVHPELAFWSLNGGCPLPEPKKAGGRAHPPGLELRRRLLLAAGIPPSLLAGSPPRGAAEDDRIDACGALAVARALALGGGQPFPDPPGRDAHGIPVAIWTLRASEIPMTSQPTTSLPVTPEDIRAAHARIRPHIRRTPAWTLPGAFGHDGPVSLKLELFQHAGSFKPRGAFNTLLAEAAPAAGVAAASGGNHGAAVAYAAQRLGLKARIFVPEIASPAKVEVIRRQGAEVVIGGARYADALASCEAYIAEGGALSVHAYDAPGTIAGQGTVALEWEEDAPGLDTVLVAVGGGGLIAGMAAWWAGRVRVVGVEPRGSRALHAALEAGHPVDVDINSVAADSLGARRTGDHVLAIARSAVDHVTLVDDEAILEAQRVLWRDWRIASEPGGATALAALLSGAYRPRPGERLGVLLCGGNVELGKLAAVVG